jgi:hypothetical protein
MSVALHPYFKLTYIKLVWGGLEEQEAKRKAGNPFAKNWQDEAQKILEQVVCMQSLVTAYLTYVNIIDGALL